MNKAEEYLKKNWYHSQLPVNVKEHSKLMESFASSQVNEALEEEDKNEDKIRAVEFEIGRKSGVKFALEQIEKSLPSDEEVSNIIESYIDKHGYKMHDLSMDNECLIHGGVENMVILQRNKTQEAINKLKKG